MSTSATQLWAAIDMGAMKKRKSRQNMITSNEVEPGQATREQEHSTRKDSAVESTSPPSTSKPSACLSQKPSTRGSRLWINWKALIFLTIYALLAFGSLYVLLEYLLSAVRANATSCNASMLATTVDTTIWSTTTLTQTTIVYEQVSSSETAPAAASPPSPTLDVSTLSIEYTVFTTVTVPRAAQSTPAGPYSFVVVDGTTSWLNNMTPNSALPITTAVTSVPVVPVPATTSEPEVTTTIRSTSVITNTRTVTASVGSTTQAALDTFTAPPVSSTTFSYSPELTTTLFETQYSTITVSRVSSPSSFAGTNTDGSNATSAQPALEQTQPPIVPITTTQTELVILSVSSTAATTTLYLTTTIGATITQTITPSAVVPASEGSAVLTGEPITLTQTVGSEPTYISTSVNLPESNAAPTSGPSSTTSTTTSTSASWTPITLTTFVSGHGTTVVVNSTTAGTTPMSPGFNGTSTSVTSTILITSFVNGHGTTFPVTTIVPVASATSNSTTTIATPGSTIAASAQTAASPPSSSTTSPTTSTSVAHTLTGTSSTVSRSHTFGHSSNGPASSSDSTSTHPSSSSATKTTSSSSFSNPFPPSSATAIPSAGCGEQGNFTANFDDLPTFTPSKRQQSWNATKGSDLGQYPPVTFNGRPYHHLYFSDGYVYAPQKVEPYSPASSPNVAAFADPMRTGWGRNSTGKNNVEPGEFGDSYRDDAPAFWFDATTAYLGCDNPGPDACTIEATAYAWNAKADDEVPIAAQNFTIPPCSKNCKMVQVAFPGSFKSLSGLQFRAIVDNEPRTFYLDDLNMRWTNSSCSAGMMRQESR